MTSVNIGLIGCGRMGKQYVEVLRNMEGFNLKAIADKSKQEITTVPCYNKYTNYQEMLDKEKLDAIIISTPITTHLEIMKNVAENDLCTLLDKPAGVDAKETQQMKKMILNSNSKLMIGMIGRYFTEFLAAYDAISKGEIGEIKAVYDRIHIGLDPFPMQYLDKQLNERGVGLENGIYCADRYLWLTGKDIKEVEILYFGNEFFGEKLEDNIRGDFISSDGTKGNFSLRWTNYEEFDSFCEVIGSLGKLSIRQYGDCTLIKNSETINLFNQDEKFNKQHLKNIALRRELNDFANFFESSEQLKLVDEMIAAKKAIDLIYE